MPDHFVSFDDEHFDTAGADGPPHDIESVPAHDRGDFTLEQRLAVRRLLRGPFISGTDDKETYNVVLRSAETFNAYLANLMIDLVIDETGEIAYLREWAELPEGAPSLYQRAPLTHIQTAIVLNLRKKLANTLSGERTIVDRQDVFEETLPYQQNVGTDRSKQQSDFDNAWNGLIKKNLMKKTPIPDRWEISPVLASIFSAEEVAAVRKSYQDFSEQMTGAAAGIMDESMEDDDE